MAIVDIRTGTIPMVMNMKDVCRVTPEVLVNCDKKKRLKMIVRPGKYIMS